MAEVVTYAPDDLPVSLEINEETLGNLAFIIHSEAYRSFYEPFLRGMLRSYYTDLANPSKERKDQKPDDYLRGGIMVINALLRFPQELLDEHRASQERESQRKSEAEEYQERADSGSISRMGVNYDEEY